MVVWSIMRVEGGEGADIFQGWDGGVVGVWFFVSDCWARMRLRIEFYIVGLQGI